MISRRLRFEVLRRDNYTCRYCGASPRTHPDVVLEIDHVIPVTLGGDDDPRNLVTACADCNAGKSSVPPEAPLVEDVDATALLFRDAVIRAAEQQRAEIVNLDAQLQEFHDEWGELAGLLPSNWPITVSSYINAGFTVDDLKRNVYLAVVANVPARSVFPYFCGICRNQLADRHERARRLIEDGDV